MPNGRRGWTKTEKDGRRASGDVLSRNKKTQRRGKVTKLFSENVSKRTTTREEYSNGEKERGGDKKSRRTTAQTGQCKKRVRIP